MTLFKMWRIQLYCCFDLFLLDFLERRSCAMQSGHGFDLGFAGGMEQLQHALGTPG